MTSVYFDSKLKELVNPTQLQIDNLEWEAKQHGYTLDWERKNSYSTTQRCGWREDMMKRRRSNRRCNL